MIAVAFAYSNYRFSQYKFINFEELVFYQKADIFTPKLDEYVIVLYSSKKDDLKKILSKLKRTHPILAIDFFQKNRQKMDANVYYLSSDINTLIKFVQRFNINELPSLFRVKKHTTKLYKQNSPIETIR